MPSHQLPDGRWHHTFSASWMSDYATCPERARRRFFKLTRSGPNDYIALGSAVHAGIEAAIGARLDDDPEFTVERMRFVAHGALVDVMSEEGYEPRKWSTDDLRRLLDQHLDTFNTRVLPTLQPLLVEHEFDVPLHTDPFRTITMRGRIDYVDAQLGPIDWKTAGSPHKVWEKERWDVQSTVYLLAEEARTGELRESMRYVVFVHDKDLQTYSVLRQAEHQAWLRLQALQAARMVEAGLPYWPMHDAGWWCSEKWCPAWSDCKGAVLGANDKEAA